MKPLIFPSFFSFSDNPALQIPQYFLRKQLTQDEIKQAELISVTEDFLNRKTPWLCCVECKNRITTRNWKIQINGQETHTEINPQGYVFQIDCYKIAPGCICLGIITDEYTWFPGYTWQVVVCSLCYQHLGWRYRASVDNFYGLIKNQLIEDENNC